MTEGAEDEPTSDLLAERKMRFLFALRTRGVTDSRVLTAMEKGRPGSSCAAPSPTGPMRTCRSPSRLRPDDQPAFGGWADDAGLAGEPARYRAGGGHRLSGRDPVAAGAAGSTRLTAIAAWSAKPESCFANWTW